MMGNWSWALAGAGRSSVNPITIKHIIANATINGLRIGPLGAYTTQVPTVRADCPASARSAVGATDSAVAAAVGSDVE
jgi:hypothetical protein